MKPPTCTVIFALAAALVASPCWAANYFVAPSALGANDGSSAGNAWGLVKTALNTAWTTAGDHTIYLAAGTYTGTGGAGGGNWYDNEGNLGGDFFVDGVLSFREAGARAATSITFVGAGVGSTIFDSAGSGANFETGSNYAFFVVDQAADFTGITFQDLSIDLTNQGAIDVLIGRGDFGGGFGTNVNNLEFTFDNVSINLDTEKLLAMDDVGAADAIFLINGTVVNTNRALGDISFIEIDNALIPAPVADIVRYDGTSLITRLNGALDYAELRAVNVQSPFTAYNNGTPELFVSPLPIPEPAGAMLAAIGLSSLLRFRRRRNNEGK